MRDGIRLGSAVIETLYGGLLLLLPLLLALKVFKRDVSPTETNPGLCARLAPTLWLCNGMNVLFILLIALNPFFPLFSIPDSGPAYATSVLQDSVPDPWTGPNHNQYGGMAQFTADELNRIHWHAQFGHVTYVPATVPSTDPEIVSVNPIDDYAWGAAAYSMRTHRCYVILTVSNKGNPGYGHTYYGRLDPGVPCVGAAATSLTATATSNISE